MGGRADWIRLPDADLLAGCEVDTYRASGPGGQKRNKTSSAVRLRHRGSGLMAIAEESRSQHENRETALKRLRQEFALGLREPLPPGSMCPGGLAAHPDLTRALGKDGRLRAVPKSPDFWPAAATVLDALEAAGSRVSDAAGWVGTSTANLIDFLQTDAKLWQAANALRSKYGEKPLRSST